MPEMPHLHDLVEAIRRIDTTRRMCEAAAVQCEQSRNAMHAAEYAFHRAVQEFYDTRGAFEDAVMATVKAEGD